MKTSRSLSEKVRTVAGDMITVHAGDIIAFRGHDFTSWIIRLATRGPSHVGIVATVANRLVLVESTTLAAGPCIVKRKPVNGVQAHLIDDRVRDYKGAAWVYRLAEDERETFDDIKSSKLSAILLNQFFGREYDLSGAIWSGSKFMKLLRFLRVADVSTVFCSELVARCYQALGLMNKGNASEYSPAKLLWELRQNGTVQAPIKLRAVR